MKKIFLVLAFALAFTTGMTVVTVAGQPMAWGSGPSGNFNCITFCRRVLAAHPLMCSNGPPLDHAAWTHYGRNPCQCRQLCGSL
jgi:hypothetical protein